MVSNKIIIKLSFGTGRQPSKAISLLLTIARNTVTNGIEMTEALLYYLIVINVVTFLVYGIDKWKAVNQRGQNQTRLSYAERKQPRPKVKAYEGDTKAIH